MQFSAVCCCNLLKNRWFYWFVFCGFAFVMEKIGNIVLLDLERKVFVEKAERLA